MVEDAPDFTDLFRPRADAAWVRRHVGDIALTTGELAAVDPVTGSSAVACETVPTGVFPVWAIERPVGNGDPDVLALAIELSRRDVVRWQPSRVMGRGPIAPGALFGVAVDGGRAGFVDADALSSIDDLPDGDARRGEQIRIGEHVLVATRAGAGDGVYVTWIAEDAEGSTVAALLDFNVLEIRKPQYVSDAALAAYLDAARRDLVDGSTDEQRGALRRLVDLGSLRDRAFAQVLHLVESVDTRAWATLHHLAGECLSRMVRSSPSLERPLRDAAMRTPTLRARLAESAPSPAFLRWVGGRLFADFEAAPAEAGLLTLSRHVRLESGVGPWISAFEATRRAANVLLPRLADETLSVLRRTRDLGSVGFDEIVALLERVIAVTPPDRRVAVYAALLDRPQRADLCRALSLDTVALGDALIRSLDDDEGNAFTTTLASLLDLEPERLPSLVDAVMRRADRLAGAGWQKRSSLVLNNYVGRYLLVDGELDRARLAQVNDEIRRRAPRIAASALEIVTTHLPASTS